MKLVAKIFMILGCMGIMASSFCACSDDDDDKKTKDDYYSASVDAFLEGYKNNFLATYNETTKTSTKAIVVDMRESGFAEGHLKGAINIPATENAFYSDTDVFYTELEGLDPVHGKQILLVGEGVSQLTAHVAKRISAMGWGPQKTFLLNDSFDNLKKKTTDYIVKD